MDLLSDLPGVFFIVAFIVFDGKGRGSDRVVLGLHGVQRPLRFVITEKQSRGDGVFELRGIKKWSDNVSHLHAFVVPEEHTGTLRIVDESLEKALFFEEGVWKLRESGECWNPKDTFGAEVRADNREKFMGRDRYTRRSYRRYR